MTERNPYAISGGYVWGISPRGSVIFKLYALPSDPLMAASLAEDIYAGGL
jgi:hypothetical protein